MIGYIPGYNAESDMTRCLGFLWRPSDEDWARAYEHAQSPDRHPSRRYSVARSVVELDILGMDAALRGK